MKIRNLKTKTFVLISLNTAVSLILATFVIFLISSCATMEQKVYHGFLMKGSIIEADEPEVYLCIGSRDGASVGQELDVHKIFQNKPKAALLRRVHTGKVKIIEIIDTQSMV